MLCVAGFVITNCFSVKNMLPFTVGICSLISQLSAQPSGKCLQAEYTGQIKPLGRTGGNQHSGRKETTLKALDHLSAFLFFLVKPLPRKRCEAGFTGKNRYATITEAVSSIRNAGFQNSGHWCHGGRNTHSGFEGGSERLLPSSVLTFWLAVNDNRNI